MVYVHNHPVSFSFIISNGPNMSNSVCTNTAVALIMKISLYGILPVVKYFVTKYKLKNKIMALTSFSVILFFNI
jgi:hypothetical protein